jgi:hypothetical protein
MYALPYFGLRAYALFYSKHSSKEPFRQSELDWIVGSSMKKKIFATLLRAGWIKKISRREYKCTNPDTIFTELLDFKVPDLIKNSQKSYLFTGLSAVEIWSDYSYVQRGREKSPYFIKILKKDLKYWKNFFNQNNIPNYIAQGATLGEYVILIPVEKINFVEKDGLKVESLKNTMKQAKKNEMFLYAYNFMKNKYGD